MVHEATDSITGARRDDVLINRDDASRIGVHEGDALRLHNSHGEMKGRARFADIAPGNIELHWPEANVLIDSHRRAAQAGVPDYNALVEVEKA